MNTQLIADLYSTQNSPEKWPTLLDRLLPVVGAKAAGLIVVDFTGPVTDAPNQFGAVSSNQDKKVMAEYNRKYAKYEAPIVQKSLRMTPGEMVTDPGFDDIESIMQRPDIVFVREKMGLFHRFGVRLNDEKAWNDVIAFQYGLDRDNVTSEEFAQFSPYFPHIAQAVALGRMYDSIRERYSAVLTVLDRINLGMLLLRNDSTVILSNEFAKETIDRSNRLQVINGRLTSNGKFADDLKSAVSTIADTVIEGGKASSHYVRLGSDEETDSLLVELSPLIDSNSEVESNFKGVLALLIDPGRGLALNKEMIRRVYSLTPAETDIAELIAGEGLGYKLVAERRSVSIETVKTQSKALMGKMKASGRAGIIKKVLALGLPFK